MADERLRKPLNGRKVAHSRGGVDSETTRDQLFREIEKRREVEIALRASEERFHNLVEHSLHGVLIVQEGKILFVNSRVAEVVGAPVDELMAMPFDEFMREFVMPDYRELIQTRSRDRLAGKDVPPQYEIEIFTRHGHRRWIGVSAQLVSCDGRPAVQTVLVDVTARKEAEAALRDSEEKYRTLVESALNAIFSVDRDGVFLFLNPVAAEALGGKPEDFVGKKMEELFPLAIAARQLESIRRVIDTSRGERTERETVMQGEPRWYVTNIQPLNGPRGERKAAFLVSTDITEKVRASQSLKRERDFTNSILQTANSLIVCLDDQARITVFNGECERVTGYRAEEVLGMSWPETFLPPECRHEGLKNFREWVMLHPNDRDEGPLLTRSGEIRNILWSNSSFISPETGELSAIAIGQDITEAKQAQEQLWQAETRYRSLVEHLPAITYIAALDEASTTLYISPQTESLLGYSQTDYGNDPDTWRKALHPDDRERVLAELARTHEAGEPFDCEYRMVGRDGQVVWFRDQAALVRDGDGVPLVLQGVQYDITDRVMAEERLVESERKFRNLAEHSLQGIAVTQNGKPVFVNGRCAEILETTVEEVLRLGADEFITSYIHPDSREEARRIQEAMEGDLQATSHYETQITTFRGNARWIEVFAQHTIFDGKEGLYSVLLDISERKRIEAALQLAHEQLQEERQALLEKNIALKEVLGQIKDEANQVKLQIQTNVERLIRPTLLKLKERVREADRIHLALLESLLADICSPFITGLETRFANLTPRETEICNMIRNGLQSKEIGVTLGISVRTVEKFRQKIRQKLGLGNSEANLTTFLRSF